MASRSVNRVVLIGRLGRDAETIFTASETAITKFSVATSQNWKDKATGDWKEETTWTSVVLFRGEAVAPYLLKGTQVYVDGRLRNSSYEKEGKKVYTTDVICNEVILLGGNNSGGVDRREEPASAPRKAPVPQGHAAPIDGVDEDDVPF